MTAPTPRRPFSQLTVDHLVLRVEDLPRMRAFYETTLGCPCVRAEPELGLYQFRAGAVLIDLVVKGTRLGGNAPIHREAGNLDHLCLRVEPFDAPTLIAWLEGQGLPAEPARRRFGAQGFGLSIYSADPEGNRLEFKAPSDG